MKQFMAIYMGSDSDAAIKAWESLDEADLNSIKNNSKSPQHTLAIKRFGIGQRH